MELTASVHLSSEDTPPKKKVIEGYLPIFNYFAQLYSDAVSDGFLIFKPRKCLKWKWEEPKESFETGTSISFFGS